MSTLIEWLVVSFIAFNIGQLVIRDECKSDGEFKINGRTYVCHVKEDSQ